MTPRRLLESTMTGSGAWLVTAALALFVILRLTGVADHHARLFAFETLTMWLLLPAYPIVAIAVLTDRRALAAVATVVALLHIFWVGPDLRWWPHHQPAAAGGAFTLVSANVLYHNTTDDRAAAALAEQHPDVLVVVELTPAFEGALETAGAIDDLPNRVVRPQDGGHSFGAAIYSRYPLDPGPDDLELDHHPLVTATLHLPSGDVRLVAVHTLQPLAGMEVLRNQLRSLGELADQTDLPLVLAGDFNATRQHAPFRALLSHGLRDAHFERGRGLARSWPMDKPGPAFALLDHVLVSDRVAVRDVGEITVPGSDHRAVRTRLALSLDR